MGQTLTEKILSMNQGRPVKAGETVIANVDFAALHDGSGPLLVRLMKERNYYTGLNEINSHLTN